MAEMTDSERIKSIKTKVKLLVILADDVGTGKANLLTVANDMNWLIEQAELRQIDHQASVLANKMNTAFTKEVMDKNERLREALEGLLHIEAVTQPSDYEELLKNVREYVVEALEQPK